MLSLLCSHLPSLRLLVTLSLSLLLVRVVSLTRYLSFYIPCPSLVSLPRISLLSVALSVLLFPVCSLLCGSS